MEKFMIEFKIKNVEDYLQIVEEYKGNAYFRGQANLLWTVEPSIFRDDDSLVHEVSTLNIQYSSKEFDVLSQLLKKQHYGIKTRLCDLTINPLVALYFSIEDETCDTANACVYLYDKTKAVLGDSLEAKLLLLLATTQITTLQELQNYCNKSDIKIDSELLEKIITQNYIIDYNYNFSYTNSRSFLQGGTGILFGFSVTDGSIIRKSALDVDFPTAKILIPSDFKWSIRNALKKYGICKEVLYNDVCSYKPLSYTIHEEHKNTLSVKKVFLNISVSDVMFEQEEIEKIIDEIYSKYKNDFYSDTLVFGYVFYDEQDKRNYNWIAMPQIKDGVFKLRYNTNYHKRRMDYMNREISINNIVSLTEPIVKECRQVQDKIEILLKKYMKKDMSINSYLGEVKNSRSHLYKLIYFDLQDIEHGAKQYDNYYNLSNEYCMNVDELLEHQEQWNTFNQLNRQMVLDIHRCNTKFDAYKKAKEQILNNHF